MQSKDFRKFIALHWRDYIVYIAFVFILIFFAVTIGGRGFFTVSNMLNILRQTAALSIMGVGLTFVIAMGEMDLSISAVVALAALAAALVLQAGGGILLACLAAMVCGLAVGAVNGFLVAKLQMPSFLATLAMMGLIRGVAMMPTDTAAVPITNDTFNNLFGSMDIGPVPILVIWMLVATAAGQYLLKKTRFGRQTLAVGGNAMAAKYSGVNVVRMRFMVMMLCSLMASIAGLLYAGRMHTARCTFGEGSESTVIAGVVMGGTLMTGGKGSVLGTLIGSIMIGMITNGLVIMGLSTAQQMVAQGVIIILAVALGRRPQR